MIFPALIIILTGTVLSWFFSGAETGGYALNRIHLHHQSVTGSKRAQLLEKILQNPQTFIFSVLVGNNIAIYLISQTLTNLYIQQEIGGDSLLWNAEAAATLTLTPFLFIFAEVSPKILFRKNARTLMLQCTYALRLFMFVFAPISRPLCALFSRLIHQPDSDADKESILHLSPQRVRMFFKQSLKEGSMSIHQNTMMENVIAMRYLPVGQLMTPIAELPRIPSTATVAELKAVLRASTQSRCLVYHEQDPKIYGLIHLFDLIKADAQANDPIAPYITRAHHILPSTSLQAAFNELQTRQRAVAIISSQKSSLGQILLHDIARYIANDS